MLLFNHNHHRPHYGPTELGFNSLPIPSSFSPSGSALMVSLSLSHCSRFLKTTFKQLLNYKKLCK